MKPKRGPEPVDDLLHVDILGIEIGIGLIPLIDSSQGGDFLERIIGIRRRFAIDLGLVVPIIRIRDNTQLNKNEYKILIKDHEVAKGQIKPSKYIAMNPDNIKEEIEGDRVKEPAFGLPAQWIDKSQMKNAEKLGYTVLDSTSVLATHLTEAIKAHGYDLLTRQDVKKLIDDVKKEYPVLVGGIVPKKISTTKIHRVLQNLLKEQISIKNLMDIFEVLGDHAEENKSVKEVTEILKKHLKDKAPERQKEEKAKSAV